MNEGFPQNNSEEGKEEGEMIPVPFEQPLEPEIPNVDKAGRLTQEQEKALSEVLKQYKK